MQIFSYFYKGNYPIFFSDYLTLFYHVISQTIENCFMYKILQKLPPVGKSWNLESYIDNINLLHWHDNVYRTCFIRIIHILKPPSICHCGIAGVHLCVSAYRNDKQITALTYSNAADGMLLFRNYVYEIYLLAVLL